MCAADPATQRGISLVELMVGLVVALLIAVAAGASGMATQGLQRQSGGTSVAATAALSALAGLKEDIEHAGLGFFADGGAPCAALRLAEGTTDLSQPAFSPLKVERGAASDRIDVVYAAEVSAGAAVGMAAPSDGSAVLLRSFLPVQAGQQVLLSPPPESTGTCEVRKVASVVAGTPASPQQSLGLEPLEAAAAVPAAAFPAGSRVLLFDRLRWQRYRVAGADLLLEEPLTGRSVVVLRDVVALRVQLGVAAAGSETIERWVDPTGEWAALGPDRIARVRAVRLGLVKRSPEREKPDSTGTCRASDARPQLFGAEVDPGAQWSCFRYRVATVTVPLRNVVFGVSP